VAQQLDLALAFYVFLLSLQRNISVHLSAPSLDFITLGKRTKSLRTKSPHTRTTPTTMDDLKIHETPVAVVPTFAFVVGPMPVSKCCITHIPLLWWKQRCRPSHSVLGVLCPGDFVRGLCPGGLCPGFLTLTLWCRAGIFEDVDIVHVWTQCGQPNRNVWGHRAPWNKFVLP